MSVARHWSASLDLGYTQQHGQTTLSHRLHQGPLRVQKSLYPEGAVVCHNFVLHPPAGIAGGDHLQISVSVGEQCHTVLTTPGAGKWYKSAGTPASQTIVFDVAKDAKLEWLPQENIVFNGAEAQQMLQIDLAPSSAYLGWDITCLGRSAQGETLQDGAIRQRVTVRRAGEWLWLEQGKIVGGDVLLSARAGLQDCTVFGTLLAVWSPDALLADEAYAKSIMADLQAIAPKQTLGVAHYGVTRLPELMIARFVGQSSEAAREYFIALWRILRPQVMNVPSQDLRIWQT